MTVRRVPRVGSRQVFNASVLNLFWAGAFIGNSFSGFWAVF